MASLTYRPEIDGLRAVAIILVVLYHADLGFPGGYVGVDVFFVISGFLITSLILKDLDAGAFSILEFWARRVRRIIPALTVVMAACLLAGWFVFWPDDYVDLGRSAAAQSLFVSNAYFWKHSGYFAGLWSAKPLLHTWSLSVEEQFYLLFPLTLLILAKCKPNLRFKALGIVAVLSFLLSLYGSYEFPSAAFYLIPTRAWELLAGALLAILGSRVHFRSEWAAESLCWAGLALIGVAALLFGKDTRYPGLAAGVPVLGTLLVIWSNSARLSLAGRALASKPIVFVGLISYSWYLWHWPVLVFSEYWSLEPVEISSRIALVVGSALLAVASWKFIEIPFRKRRAPEHRGRVFAFGALSLLTISISGYLVAKSQGVTSRAPPEAVTYAAGKKDRAFTDNLTVEDALQGKLVPMGSRDPAAPAHTLVWGDSHAMAVMPVVDWLCAREQVRCFGAAHSSTAPLAGFVSKNKDSLKGDSVIFNDAVLEFVERHNVQNVLLVGLWEGYRVNEEEERFKNFLSQTVDRINRAGAKAWIMLQVPSHDVDVPYALARAALAKADIATLGLTVAKHEQKMAIQRRAFAAVGDGLVVLDPLTYFAADNGYCRLAVDGKSLYSDYNHLSVTGAMTLRPMFEPMFIGSREL